MSIRKTLGGDRLGSGKRMQVELHNYERSTHDLGYLWRSTMSAGTLVPFMSELALPGDTFDINLGCDVKTHPTVGPLFGSYKVQLDVFFAPLRLYIAELHNNRTGIGMNMSAVKFPVLHLQSTAIPSYADAPNLDVDNANINPSCIFNYLGIRGAGYRTPADATEAMRNFNGIPYLSYVEIYKQYYANKMEEQGAVIHTTPETIHSTITDFQAKTDIATAAAPVEEQGTALATPVVMHNSGTFLITYSGGLATQPSAEHIMVNTDDGRRFSLAQLTSQQVQQVGTTGLIVYFDSSLHGYLTIVSWQMIQPWEIRVVSPSVHMFPLEEIELMKDAILQNPIGTAFSIRAQGLEPYSLAMGQTTGQNHMSFSQEGLLLKTYQSDLFNNWLQTEWIDGAGGIADITAIDTTSGSFNIDTLILSRKVYDMLNRIAVSGGSYADWLDAVYTENRYKVIESPMYMGGLIKELVFQEVVSNSGSTSGDSGGQPLGTLAGKGVMSNKHKGGTVIVKADEPGYIIGIVSLTPRIDYSQGNKWDVHLQTMDDLHKPALDEIGFQELITEQMAWWSTVWNEASGTWVTRSAGKQPAWINYMTNVNQVKGNFAIADNEMFMTLNRRYERATDDSAIEDLTTYIDPSKFNHIFAQTALDAQNFWTQISVDITARRKMSAKLMPNL